MDSFSDRVHDPLLFLNTDKSDLDAFLMNTSADMAEELHANVSEVKMENSLDLDSLEGNGHLGDMSWLHNSSLSTLTHLDNDDTSDCTNLVSVNPQSVLPIQIIQNENAESLLSSESANSAAMRLHANCSNLLDPPEAKSHSLQQQIKVSVPENVLRQEHQTIRILSVASQHSPHSSPAKTQNFLITSTRDSPHKPQTFVLSTVDGSFPAGLTISSADLPIHTSSTGPQFVLASPQKIHALSTDKNNRVLLKSGSNVLSPSQASPVLLGRLQTGVQPQVYQQIHLTSTVPTSSAATLAAHSDSSTVSSTTNTEERIYPKPVFSYSCLIALALKNSKNGSLPVSEIYNFMCENFPYFKTAPDGWKNSVRHNLSLNKCFAKVDNPKLSPGAKKGCLWALNPAKISKMEDEITKWSKKDPAGLLSSMAYPENLEAIEKGQAGLHYSKKKSPPCTPITATATKTEFCEQKVDFSQIRIEKYHPNIHIEKTELLEQVKIEPGLHRDNSPLPKLEFSSSSKIQSSLKMEPADFTYPDIPVSFSSDALTDIVLQSSIWDDDLESNIDIDLICDSPSSHPLPSTHFPLTFGSSSSLAQLPHSSGIYNTSVHFADIPGSPVQHTGMSPATVRTKLLGATTPARRVLYA